MEQFFSKYKKKNVGDDIVLSRMEQFFSKYKKKHVGDNIVLLHSRRIITTN